MQQCERCGFKLDPTSYLLLDYCDVCSENLCAGCFEDTACRESSDRKHRRYEEPEEAEATP